MIVYGIGMPRTGTNSLREALTLLGLSGYNTCSINKFKHENRQISNIKYQIENDFYKSYQTIPKDILIHNKFILTTRSNNNWKTSIYHLKSLDNIDKNEISYLENQTISRYEKEIEHLFCKYNCSNNLLKINIFEENNHILWKKIHKHIFDKDLDKHFVSFPKINLN